MSNANAQVIVTGEYFCDLVFGQVDAPPAPGREVFGDRLEIVPGGTFNIAAGLARVGIPTAWAVAFGTDPFSRLVRDEALKAGVQASLFQSIDKDQPRVSAAFSHDGDRGFLSASLDPVDPVGIGSMQPQWMVQTFRYTAPWIEAASSARMRGISLFGDARDCTATLDDPAVVALLDCLDVFAPSETEALRICGTDQCEVALKRLAEIVPRVVLTRADKGAVFIDKGVKGDVPAVNVAVRDSIGAGDAFNCGYLAGALAGLSMLDCVRAGCLFGAFAVTQTGGGRPPDGAQILKFAKATGTNVPSSLAGFLRGRPARSGT